MTCGGLGSGDRVQGPWGAGVLMGRVKDKGVLRPCFYYI